MLSKFPFDVVSIIFVLFGPRVWVWMLLWKLFPENSKSVSLLHTKFNSFSTCSLSLCGLWWNICVLNENPAEHSRPENFHLFVAANVELASAADMISGEKIVCTCAHCFPYHPNTPSRAHSKLFRPHKSTMFTQPQTTEAPHFHSRA